jgi:plasmid replication initiation protein
MSTALDLQQSGADIQSPSHALRSPPTGEGQLDLFAPALADILYRDARDLMNRVPFALSKKPRHTPIIHEWKDLYLKIKPENPVKAIANIWDHHIIIFLVSQLNMIRSRANPAATTVEFRPADLLRAVRRGDGGKDYEWLGKAIDRLWNTTVVTNVADGAAYGEFRMLASRMAFNRHTKKPIEKWDDIEWRNVERMRLGLPEWIINQIDAKRVLKLHEDYFLISSGLDCVLYRLARVCADWKPEGWSFTIAELHNVFAVESSLKRFAFDVRKAVERQALPDYELALGRTPRGNETLIFRRRTPKASALPAPSTPSAEIESLSPADAKRRFTNILAIVKDRMENWGEAPNVVMLTNALHWYGDHIDDETRAEAEALLAKASSQKASATARS